MHRARWLRTRGCAENWR